MSHTLPVPIDSRETLCLGGDAAVRRLFCSSAVRVIQFRCLNDGNGLRTQRQQSWPVLTVEFQGISEVLSGRRRFVIDPMHAVAHAADTPYATLHPWGCHCRGCSFSVRPDIAAEVFAPRLRVLAHHQTPTPQSIRLSNADLLYSRRVFRALLSPVSDPLEIEESVLHWLASVGRDRGAGLSRNTLRWETQLQHRRLVTRARGFLSRHHRQRLHLDDLAQALHSSAPHITRVFRRETGLTAHRYLTQVRLLGVLDDVVYGAEDLSSLALERGFSSHSHMTAAFHREFGMTPSDWRAVSKPRANELRRRIQAEG